jgi:CHAT domain-containing protein
MVKWSLWQVSDQAAAETMERFYRPALEPGAVPAEALRQAKLAIRRPGAAAPAGPARAIAGLSGGGGGGIEPGHPFLWAPFIYIGLGR